MNRSKSQKGSRKRKLIALSGTIGIVVLLWLTLASCTPLGVPSPIDPPAGNSGSLLIRIASPAAKILLPPIDMTPAGYQIFGSGPNGSSFSVDTGQTQAEVTHLELGSWTILVEALNAGGTLIGRGQATIDLAAGAAQTVTIQIAPIEGSGILQLTVAWTAADIPAPAVSARLLAPAGSAIPLAFSLGAGRATCSQPSVPTGYYTLEVKLMDGGKELAGAVEVVRIVNGQTTSGSFTFNGTSLVSGSVDVVIVPEMQDPIEVTLSGAKAEFQEGESMTVTASVPAGTGPVVCNWYLNGLPKGTGEALTVGSGLAAGAYRLDANVFSADGLQAGSATHSFNVTPRPSPVSVTLAWDANSESNLAGYKLYYGTSSGSYSTCIDVGNRTSYTVNGLDPLLTYYFALTAYNTEGQESGYSGEVVLPHSI